MDEYFRKLERRYFAGDLSPQESWRLRELYTTYFDHCPTNYVVKEITDSVHSYSAWLRNHHIETYSRLLETLGHLRHVPEMDQYLTSVSMPYPLVIEISTTEGTAFPMLVARATISIKELPPETSTHWLEKMTSAADHIRNILAATFSQCGYTECVSVITPQPRMQIISEGCQIIGVGSPRSAFLNDRDLVTLPELGEIYRQAFGDDLVAIRAAVPLNTSDLIVPEIARHRGPPRNWLLLLRTMQEMDITEGHLVLAGVTTRAFTNQAINRPWAERQLTNAFEADVVDPPEMIFFIPKHNHMNEDAIWVVPTSDNYDKKCEFLRLLAEV